MNAVLQILGHEQYIKNRQGQPEFIVLPIEAYQQLVDLIEEHGLGLAMREAEDSKRYDKEAALKFLDDEG